MLAELQAKPTTRAEDILGWVPDYWKHYEEQAQSASPDARPEALARRHPRARARDRLHGRDLQRPRRGAAGERARTAARCRASRRPRRRDAGARATPTGIHPLAMPGLPTHLRGLVEALAEYQQLAADAAWDGTAADGVRALAAHPLVRSLDVAERALRRDGPRPPRAPPGAAPAELTADGATASRSFRMRSGRARSRPRSIAAAPRRRPIAREGGRAVARLPGRSHAAHRPTRRSARLARARALDLSPPRDRDDGRVRGRGGTAATRYCPADAPYSCRRFAEHELRAVLNDGACPRAAAARVGRSTSPRPRIPAAYEDEIATLGGVDLFLLAAGSLGRPRRVQPAGLAAHEPRRASSRSPSRRGATTSRRSPRSGRSTRCRASASRSGSARSARTRAPCCCSSLGEGSGTALARTRALAGFDPAWPASVVRLCRGARIVADAAAAGCFSR